MMPISVKPADPAICPKWKDGVHCFVPMVLDGRGGEKIATSITEIATRKVCVCGTVVEARA